MSSNLIVGSKLMKVLLLQLDGKIPNLALMRVSAHHKEWGDEVELHHGLHEAESRLSTFDRVYASLIFTKTRDNAERLKELRPDTIIGGTGWDLTTTLEGQGIDTREQDYSLYPNWTQSIGFTQRGCRLHCSFCVVPTKEGKVVEYATVADIWRGEPNPRQLLLLDNDFFGQPRWRDRIAEIRDGGFKVSFNQGINARMLTDEAAEAIASVRYYDDSMKSKRIYTAWDSRKDEATLFRGLKALVRYGVKPDHIMVYMLIGYWEGETADDWLYRQGTLREFGCRPYPMPYVRNRETLGFQRWVIGAYDKTVPWKVWCEARFEPRNLKVNGERMWQAKERVGRCGNCNFPVPIADLALQLDGRRTCSSCT